MPKIIKRPIGTVYIKETKRTFWDKLKEWTAIGIGITVFLWFMSHAGG